MFSVAGFVMLVSIYFVKDCISFSFRHYLMLVISNSQQYTYLYTLTNSNEPTKK